MTTNIAISTTIEMEIILNRLLRNGEIIGAAIFSTGASFHTNNNRTRKVKMNEIYVIWGGSQDSIWARKPSPGKMLTVMKAHFKAD